VRTEVPYELLHPTADQARKKYRALDELACSLNDHGLLQNLVVKEIRNPLDSSICFEVIAGERRRRAIGMLLLPADEQVKQHGKFLGTWENAARKSGSKGGVPVFIIPANMADAAHLIENIHRENLYIWELGRRLAAYQDAGQTCEWIAFHLQKSVTYTQNRILIGRQLSTKVSEALENLGEGDFLSRSALVKIARLYDPILQEPLHEQQVEALELLLGKTRRAPKQSETESRSERIRVHERAKRLANLKRIPGHARPYVKALYEYLFSPGLMQKPDFDWD